MQSVSTLIVYNNGTTKNELDSNDIAARASSGVSNIVTNFIYFILIYIFI